jgi:hypothetical protein
MSDDPYRDEPTEERKIGRTEALIGMAGVVAAMREQFVKLALTRIRDQRDARDVESVSRLFATVEDLCKGFAKDGEIPSREAFAKRLQELG